MKTDSDAAGSGPAQIVIPKEKAVFRLDANGCWHNDGGRFENKKIIDYFHASIRHDADGYFLFQDRGICTEKVYFSYADTALFVFDVILSEPVTVVLNTGARFPLEPAELCVQNDSLYVIRGDQRVKFTDRSLLAVSDLLSFEGDAYVIRLAGRRHRIEKR
ncbi:MAG: MFS transporter permease [Desulfobacterales bacterium]